MWFTCLTAGCGHHLVSRRYRLSGFCATCMVARAPAWGHRPWRTRRPTPANRLRPATSIAYRISQRILKDHP